MKSFLFWVPDLGWTGADWKKEKGKWLKESFLDSAWTWHGWGLNSQWGLQSRDRERVGRERQGAGAHKKCFVEWSVAGAGAGEARAGHAAEAGHGVAWHGCGRGCLGHAQLTCVEHGMLCLCRVGKIGGLLGCTWDFVLDIRIC